ncbi:MAG: peptide chain release factor 1 [Verrucomicrobiota bacterium]|nr:peptide chain release factor 1 [Verrucomicrobiota bacterium]
MSDLPDITPFQKRMVELDQLMGEPNFYSDGRRAAEIAREQQKLSRLMELADLYNKIERDLADNRVMADDATGDAELREMAREEIPSLEAKLAQTMEDVLSLMIPPDPADSRNTIVEIRGGAGGDEASLFAGDLFRMYTRYAEENGMKIEPMGASMSEAGGYKEVAFLITGQDVYKRIKYESGVHRVQRVPVTEANGRIHTSTATVAVLPEAEDVDIHIDPSDLEITVARASGPGGQGVNTTDSAVQIIHKPTGLIVKCADERSQLKNKAKALKVLRSRLLERKQDEEQKKYDDHRRSQVGTGDRSERIRTYNFPQGRVTDHRIGFSLYSLPQFMDGNITEMLTALESADRQARIAALTGRPSSSRKTAVADDDD